MKKAAVLMFAAAFLMASVGVAWAKQDEGNGSGLGVPFQQLWQEVSQLGDQVSGLQEALGSLTGQVGSFFDLFVTQEDHDSDVAGLQNQIDTATATHDSDVEGLQSQIDALESRVAALEADSQGSGDQDPPACVPGPETCDGVDNDCDGLVDEDLGVADSCGVCVDLDDPATYGGRVEYDATYKQFRVLDDILLCPKSYTLESGAGLLTRLEDGDSRIINCNGATLTSSGGQATAVFATCNLNSAHTTGCTPDFRVMNCHIANFYNGLTVKLIDGAQVLNNSITDSGAGITLLGVQGATVQGNTVAGANYSGIYLKRNQTVPYPYQRRSESNQVIGNTVTDSHGYGMYLDTSLYNTVRDNRITGSNWYGLYVFDSGYNTIYNNYFVNSKNAFDYAASWENYWNVDKAAGPNIVGGAYLGGNYWSDYTGADTDGDGLGDTDIPYLPYALPGGTPGGGDDLPLVE